MQHTNPRLRVGDSFSAIRRSEIASLVELVDVAEIGPRLEAKLENLEPTL